MGAIWIPLVLIMMITSPEYSLGSIFFILGWIYFVIWIIHKDEWDKKKGHYLIQNEKIRWLGVFILGLLILVGFIFFFFWEIKA